MLIVFVLVGGHYLGLLQPVERGLLTLLEPIGRFGNALTHRSNGNPRTNDATEQRLAELEDRIAELSVENAGLRSSLAAVTELGEQQVFLRERKFSGIHARIFARSSDPTSQVVAIDAGRQDGLAIGAPVIVRNGILIGRVHSLTDTSAQVLLTTDNRSSLTAVMADNPTAQGVVNGVRGLSLSMSLIPQTEELKIGEIAVTSGTDAGVPPGLTLGELDRFEKQQGAVLQSASLRPLFSASRLDAVTVLTGIRP